MEGGVQKDTVWGGWGGGGGCQVYCEEEKRLTRWRGGWVGGVGGGGGFQEYKYEYEVNIYINGNTTKFMGEKEEYR